MARGVRDQAPEILMVEDDLGYVEIARRCLEETGYRHRLVHLPNGRRALDYLLGAENADPEGTHPALVLLDIRMPGLTGFEVLEALRKRPNTEFLPIVVLTSSESETDLKRSYRSGANGCVNKPMSYEETRELFRAIVAYWLFQNRYPD